MIQFTVNSNQITFNVSSVGPVGPSGQPFSALSTVAASGSISASQSGTVFNNQGATAEIDLALPVAATPPAPMSFSLFVAANQNLALVAPSGVSIIYGPNSSSVGGSISSNAVGNFVSIALVSATQWVVTSISGVWNLA